jgi:membrane-bound serine protease (ClpP class)
MVRWLNSPVVMGLLLMVGLLGLYVEFNTPGLGLAGLVAVICFTILIGSKYLIGLANWVEVALFVVGILLLLIELFLIPGFGIPGFAGIACILAGLFGMLIKNAPDRLPWPQSDFDWLWFTYGVSSILLGFAGFVILAILLGKCIPKVGFLSGLILLPTAAKKGDEIEVSMTSPPEKGEVCVKVGQTGEAVSRLRPAGKARFGDAVVDVVAEGAFIDRGAKVEIIAIYGNRVVVKAG